MQFWLIGKQLFSDSLVEYCHDSITHVSEACHVVSSDVEMPCSSGTHFAIAQATKIIKSTRDELALVDAREPVQTSCRSATL